MKVIYSVALIFLITLSSWAQTPSKRKLRPSDIYRMKDLSDAQVSPEGKWVVYVLSHVDSVKDKNITNLWMTSWDGAQTLQLTSSDEGESKPAWSPDGKYISFLSSRYDSKHSQVWLMDRRGGEGKKLTTIKGEVQEYKWSPDGTRIALAVTDTLNYDTSKEKNPKPHVIDRVHFKQDMEGFLDSRHTHLYLLTLETKKLDTLTRGDYDEKSPAWSPDGKQLAFVSNRSADPDRNENTDIWIMDAAPKGNARQLTAWTGSDATPAWSADGKSIAYIRSASSNNYLMYDGSLLAVVPSSGGEPILLTSSLDRPSYSTPVWSHNGTSIAMVIGDDRKHYIIEVPADGGAITKVLEGNRSFFTVEKNPAGGWLSMMSEPQLPSELYAIENNTLRRLTHHQDEFVNSVELSTVESFTSKSKDGTLVSGLLNIPPNTTAKKLPLILYIHGGPVAQDDWGFDLSRHMLAADGYAVAAVNYRGSDSRGVAFQKAIYGDWGNKEVIDLLGAVDHLVKQGVADPDRLGVGGWSYGGILTNYLIASDTRFKAAVSGAGSALQLSLFGVDQYILQFENELGMPWNNLDRYLKISYPFLKANRIKTPTLYMVGEKDFNVPSVGSEQMYEALRVQGVPTKLIIYPGQFHGLTIPSYRKDRYTRYLQWYNTYLKK